MSNAGRAKRVRLEDAAVLKQLVAERPAATLGEITAALVERAQRAMHPAATVRKALQGLGIQRFVGR